jgi:Zn-dependent M28 family amino/carboxypeptidase
VTTTDTAVHLRSVVGTLAGEIGPRPHSEPALLARVAEFIAGELRSSGLGVSFQEFSFRGNAYRNVIADLPGAADPGRVLVVGAHYDTVEGSPGADDNASGVAGLLALARAMSGARLPATVRFVAFALEEPPVYRTRNMASYHHARSLREAGTRVAGMVCLEMLGCFADGPGSQAYPFPLMKLRYPRTGGFIAMVGGRRSTRLTRRLAAGFRAATDLPLETLNAPAVVVGIDFSDHWSYAKHGYEAVMVTDTAFYRNPHYHGRSDRPETLDYARMAKVVAGLHGAIAGALPAGDEEGIS